MVKRQIKPDVPHLDVEDVISKLTVDEKVLLLTGKDFWHTNPVHRLGVPSIRLSDGPNGVRGTHFFNGIPAACLPCGTALAATWDKELIKSGGALMGREAIAKGVHVLLGPTMNIQRSPLGGRGFESFSEDPFLSGSMGAATVAGIQSTGVAATTKHFVCNDQEHERKAVSAIVTERALREIYLMPFMITERDSKPKAYMTGYNKLNGISCSEDPKLLKDILRGEWKYDGLVMSDWFGTYTATPSIEAGLDLEMPGPTRVRGQQVQIDLSIRRLTENVIDDRIRALLNLINWCMKNGTPEDAPEQGNDTPETAKKLREIGAASQVLLRNDGGVLPFKKDKTTAVIGPNAKIAAYSGGGSASLLSYYTVTPFEGISAQAKCVKYALGCTAYKSIPLLSELCKRPDGKPGLLGKVYNEPPSASKRTLVEEIPSDVSMAHLIDYNNAKLGATFYIDWEATMTPETSGDYIFGLSVAGTVSLFLDGKLVIDNTTKQRLGESFFGSGTVEEKATVSLDKGKTYKISLEFGSVLTSPLHLPSASMMGGGGFRLGGVLEVDPEEEIKKAVKLAKEVDQVIICAGLSSEWESEGYDRQTMSLPGHTNRLITALTAANPNTVLVLQSGTPVSLPPISHLPPAILHSWYGGNELGNSIADVVFGASNPSGKLPVSWPLCEQDNPAFLNFRSELGRVLYGEDVFVGYRYYEKVGREVAWPFGWGLSYTTFSMSELEVDDDDDGAEGKLTVTLKVKNTGKVAGAHVIQLYITPATSSSSSSHSHSHSQATTTTTPSRPPKELKSFAKTALLPPGGEETVKLVLVKKYACSWWDESRGAWCLGAGRYGVLVGGDSCGGGGGGGGGCGGVGGEVGGRDGSGENGFLKGNFSVKRTSWWRGL